MITSTISKFKDNYVSLNQTITATDSVNRWNDTAPDANFITLGVSGHVNGPDGPNYIAYAWTSIEGYSKFGTYKGNLNDNGTFIYLGFKPAFFMMKGLEAGAHWLMYDNKRNTYNPTQETIAAQASSVANTGAENAVDFLSNGVKCRDNTDNNINHDISYIYIAFAEMPFKYYNAV